MEKVIGHDRTYDLYPTIIQAFFLKFKNMLSIDRCLIDNFEGMIYMYVINV